jgi:Family of unknown function (DUF6292)
VSTISPVSTVVPVSTIGPVSTIARRAPAPAPLDVDRLLEASYLAAVVEELEARRIPVDAAVLNGPGRGGAIVLRDGGPTGPHSRPCVRWSGGRAWTLGSLGPAPRTGGRRRRLRAHRLAAPHEVARFVAEFGTPVGERAARGTVTGAAPAREVGWRAAHGH